MAFSQDDLTGTSSEAGLRMLPDEPSLFAASILGQTPASSASIPIAPKPLVHVHGGMAAGTLGLSVHMADFFDNGNVQAQIYRRLQSNLKTVNEPTSIFGGLNPAASYSNQQEACQSPYLAGIGNMRGHSLPSQQPVTKAQGIRNGRISVGTSPRQAGPLSASLTDSLFQFRAINPMAQEQLVDRQKKRKENHNAVERRRRDHINEMIQRLSGLVEPEASPEERSRLNKGDILQRSVELIERLTRLNRCLSSRMEELSPGFVIQEEDMARVQGES